MRDVIPDRVFRRIQAHLGNRITHAERGWEAGEQEEDTLTGDLGGSLRTDGWIETTQDGIPWRWRVTYKKFRGKGPDALESRIGADGIFQVEVYPYGEPMLIPKGVIFQAKKYRGSSLIDLVEQVKEMEEFAPGGSAVFEFGPEGYRGASGGDILATREATPGRIPHPGESLGRYLADQFLPCQSGLRGMYYDAVRKNLIVPLPGQRGVKIVHVALAHRIAVQVVANGRGPFGATL